MKRLVGLLGVVLAGICQGSFMLTMKGVRDWAWENAWLIFAFIAYLLSPWATVFSTMPRIFDIYASVPRVLWSR